MQGRANIAKCVASLVRRNPGGQAVAVVQRFLDNLAGQPDHARTFSLLAVGEIGRQGYTIYFYQRQSIKRIFVIKFSCHFVYSFIASSKHFTLSN